MYQAGYHAVGIIIDLVTLGIAVDDIVKVVRTNRAALKVPEIKENIVLWSGGKNAMDAAAKFAQQNGLKVLEQTSRGKMLQLINDALKKIVGKEKAYKIMSPLWDRASADFVKSARGEVHAFLNAQGISDTSVFIRIETEIIKEKGLKMIFHLVKGD